MALSLGVQSGGGRRGDAICGGSRTTCIAVLIMMMMMSVRTTSRFDVLLKRGESLLSPGEVVRLERGANRVEISAWLAGGGGPGRICREVLFELSVRILSSFEVAGLESALELLKILFNCFERILMRGSARADE